MTPDAEAEEIVLSLAAEELVTDRRRVHTGTVRVETVTTVRNQPVELDLATTRFEIERVPVNRFVEAVPETRTENGVTVVPVCEEVVVTRLLLREEIRLVPVRTTRRHSETVTLRSQDIVVTRDEPVIADTISTAGPVGPAATDTTNS